MSGNWAAPFSLAGPAPQAGVAGGVQLGPQQLAALLQFQLHQVPPPPFSPPPPLPMPQPQAMWPQNHVEDFLRRQLQFYSPGLLAAFPASNNAGRT